MDIKQYRCTDSEAELIPAEVLQTYSLKAPDFHTQSAGIAQASLGMKRYARKLFCQLPFCATAEAEAFGASVQLGNANSVPRIQGYAFSQLDELATLAPFDCDSGRTGEILKAIRMLRDQGETVCLNISGPFTVLTSLIDSLPVYKAMRKTPELVEQVLQRLETGLLNYALAAVDNGAQIISYSDPTGAVELLGPSRYAAFSAASSHRLLKTIDRQTPSNIVIYLCGKTSLGLTSLQQATARAIRLESPRPLAQAVLDAMADDQLKFAGHGCLKDGMKNTAVLYQINLN